MYRESQIEMAKFKRKVGAVGTHDPRIFIKFPNGIISSCSLGKGDFITLTFYDKTGNCLFSAEVKILSQNRVFLPKIVQEKFIERFGYEKISFEFDEVTKGKWTACEL